MLKSDILDDYRQRASELDARRHTLERRVQELLAGQGLKIHSVSSRTKPEGSVRYKLSRPDRTYGSLWELTDLIGLRVISYFEDTVEAAARVIEANFEIDFSNSVDKRASKDGARFGYRSLHYVCFLEGFPREARFEIQIRTVLQHAWAEIEHDLGYKTSDTLPAGLRRRFSRVAGLLEIADDEFVSIRTAIGVHEESVRQAASDPERPLGLDVVSLRQLVEDPAVRAADGEIARVLGKELGQEVFFPDYLVKMLRLAGLESTAAVRERLAREHARVVAMVGPYFEFTQKEWRLNAGQIERTPRGYSLFFLAHVLVLQSRQLELDKVSKVAAFYRELDYPNDEQAAHRVASELIRALKLAGHGAVI